MKFLFLFTSLIAMGFKSPASSQQTIPKSGDHNKRVLLIGIDGLQYEKLKALHTPNFDAFKIVKAYTGGIVGTPSQQTTGSGPGWMSVLTGVWNDKHGVISNDTKNKSTAKSVFQYLKEYRPQLQTTSIATWSPIHDFLDKQMEYVDRRFDGGTDKNATVKVLSELKQGKTDFMFLHYSDPDVIGHGSGYGEKYDRSIIDMDTYLGEIMKVIDHRKKENNEDWLVILTTDHGRRGDGHEHGSQTLEEKTIFIGMNVAGNKEFNSVVTEIEDKSFNGIYSCPSQTSILPTILTYFDIEIKKDWQLSSTSLIGEDGPRKVMLDQNRNVLTWYSTDLVDAKIYKDNILLATVPAKRKRYEIEMKKDKKNHNYTVMINNQSGSATQSSIQIIAATNWNDSKRSFFLFNDKTCLYYDKFKSGTEMKYSKSPSDKVLRGFKTYVGSIQTVLNWDNTNIFVFLNNGKYISYDLRDEKMQKGYPKEIDNSTWPGLEPYKNEIIAALKLSETKVNFFTRDGRFIVFNIKNNKTETTYAKDINEENWPGLRPYSSKISAAIDWSSDFIYFFLKDNTFLKFDKSINKVIDSPQPIDNITWPGLISY